jgi:outer membrane protein assembly factor BamB
MGDYRAGLRVGRASAGLIIWPLPGRCENAGARCTYVAAWNLADGKLAWRASLDGRADYGVPSLSITASEAVATVEYGGSRQIATFDLATGKTVWHRQLGMAALDATTNGVDVLSKRATGVITGLRPWDGATLWQANLGPFSQGGYLQYNVATDADTIYYRTFPTDCAPRGAQATCTPQLSAISLNSGAVRWQRDLDPVNPDFAVHVLAHSGVLYYQYFITAQRAFLLALDASDGHLLWRHTTDSYFVAPFIASDDALFAIGDNAKSACPARLESLSAHDGSLRWARDFPTCTEPSLRGGGWLVLG